MRRFAPRKHRPEASGVVDETAAPRPVSGIRGRLATICGQSERNILLGTVLLASAVSAVMTYVLTQYFSIDAMSSLILVPEDCWLDWGTRVGMHCFSDYPWQVSMALRPNPWQPYPILLPPDYKPFPNPYPAAAMVPHVIFGLLGKWLGAPRLGMLAYLLVLTLAVFSPAAWAARGARGLERVVVFVACGLAAIPAWYVVDRGNSAGFVVPVALVFLVTLGRRRWGLVAIMVILIALLKPQFVVLAVALFAVRQWRLGGMVVAAAAIGNIAAYLLWPRDFPGTILQSIRNTLGYGNFHMRVSNENVSFGKGLLTIPDAIKAQQTGGKIPDGFLAAPRSLIGYGVLILVVVAVVVLGRRIPPVMSGILLLTTASLFPAVSNRYYLVLALPIAAVLVRDPDGPPGSGIFDGFRRLGDRRHALGVWLSLVTALTLAQIPLPSPTVQAEIAGQMGAVGVIGSRPVVVTTVLFAPLLWLVTCLAIVVSYARRPGPSSESAD
jgi:hypothetical protein